jgi:hypothetical protein
MANLYNVPLENGVQLTLQNALLTGETTTITFTASVTSKLQASASIPGILVVDRVDANGVETPTKTEYISFTGVTGSTVTGLVRGLANSTNQDHSAGAIVELVPDVVWADSLNDVITTQHNADGTHKTLSLISLVSVTLNNPIINSPTFTGLTIAGGSLASVNILNSTMDSFTFKSPISNATQGDLIAFNAGKFERLTGTVGNILSMTSTASGLLPAYVAQSIPAGSFISKSDLTSTTGITTVRTTLNGSNVTLSLSQPATVELSANVNHGFNNLSGAYYFQFKYDSTLTGPQYNYYCSKANAIFTGSALHAVSLASGIYAISLTGLTDGNTLTIYDGTITAKVFY